MLDTAPTLFLAMFWGGGGPYSVPDLIAAYDWVNRVLLRHDEMEEGLSYLLAAGVIQREGGKFRIEASHLQAFELFRRKTRKGRFEVAGLYLGRLPDVTRPKRVVRLRQREYAQQLADYRSAFGGSDGASDKAMKQTKHRRKSP